MNAGVRSWRGGMRRAGIRTCCARCRRKPRQFLGLLGDEAAVVNSVIDLGTAHRMQAVKPFAKWATVALRSMYGMDLRSLAFAALEEATRALDVS